MIENTRSQVSEVQYCTETHIEFYARSVEGQSNSCQLDLLDLKDG